MKRLRNRRIRRSEPEANPMDGLGNLADAMLVLAVGIMLALIVNWKVDITSIASQQTHEDTQEQIPIAEEDMSESSSDELDQEDLQRIGALYYDEERGVYYAIAD